MPPDFSHEQQISGVVCGVDEAGRGPLAGPVFAAAVVLPLRLPPLLSMHLNDSKQVSAKRRRDLFKALQDCAQIGVGRADVEEIDRINILQATFLAMKRAVSLVKVDHALIDGNRAPKLDCGVSCIIGGDARSFSIAAASIVAKTLRDGEMTELAQSFPDYGWERNAGYGTAEHLAALRRCGVTKHHRRSFAPVTALL